MTSKTANSVIRYLPERTVAVLDRQQAGMTVQQVLAFGGNIPVVGSIREGLALRPDAVLIGIAPQGGRLPEEWRGRPGRGPGGGGGPLGGGPPLPSGGPGGGPQSQAGGREKLFLPRTTAHPPPRPPAG